MHRDRLLLHLKWLTGGLLYLVALWSIISMDAQTGMVPWFCLGLVLVSFIVPRSFERLTRRIWTPAAVLLLFGSIADIAVHLPDLVIPLIRLISLLGAMICVQPRKGRQDMQLLLLTLFMLIFSGVLSMSFIFVPQLMLFVPLSLALMMLVVLCEHIEAKAQNTPLFEAAYSFRDTLPSALRLMNWRLLLVWGATYTCLLVMAGLIFVTIPRLRIDKALPFLKAPSATSKTGFTDNVRFGDVTDIAKDDSIALRVDMPDGAVFRSQPYWRMAVLDEYTGEGFRVSASAREGNQAFTNRELMVSDAKTSSSEPWILYFEGGTSRYLPTPDGYSQLRFSNIIRLLVNLNTFTVSTDETSSSMLAYQVMAPSLTGTTPGMMADSMLDQAPTQGADYRRKLLIGSQNIKYPFTTLALPKLTSDRDFLRKSVLEIARSKGLKKRDPHTFAKAAEGWLSTRHTYALNSSLMPGESDPLIRWMASEEPGHCELFAGAEILLLRAAGFPARMVTGFAGGYRNLYEDHLSVRNSNAHAWVEVYDGKEWFRSDPTPGSGAFQGNWTAESDTGFPAYMDSLRILWYRHIVNFDNDQQMLIAAWTRDLSLRLRNKLLGLMKESYVMARLALQNPLRLSLYLGLVRNILIVLLLWILSRQAWKWWQGRAEPGNLRRKLVLHPLRRNAGRILASFNELDLPDDAQATGIVDALLVIRYGPVEIWPKSPAAAIKAARKIRKKLLRRA